jgi:YggT family protein
LGTDWAVRHRHLHPFAWWPRLVRRAANPLLAPLERRLRRSGANPVDAPLWLLGVVSVAGLLGLGLVGWLGGSISLIAAMRGAGPGAWIRLVLSGAIWLTMAAIIVRVIGSWLGAGRHTGWMRPVFLLTDWIITPIARRLPPMGMLDLSPFVAYFVLVLLRSLVAGLFP